MRLFEYCVESDIYIYISSVFYLCLREKDEIGDIIGAFPGIHKLIVLLIFLLAI